MQNEELSWNVSRSIHTHRYLTSMVVSWFPFSFQFVGFHEVWASNVGLKLKKRFGLVSEKYPIHKYQVLLIYIKAHETHFTIWTWTQQQSYNKFLQRSEVTVAWNKYSLYGKWKLLKRKRDWKDALFLDLQIMMDFNWRRLGFRIFWDKHD